MTAPQPAPHEQETFLRAVFGREQGYLFISTLDRTAESGKGWTDHSFVYPLQLPQILQYVQSHDAQGLDVYVAAQLYREPNARKKDKVKACPSVWSDLDTASPWGIDPEPSVVLETSPGRWHGFWRSARVLAAEEAEELSRRIAYAHHDEGADLGGWDLTQVLRLPGTHNHKYDGWPVVRLARCTDTPISDADFAQLPAAPARRTIAEPSEDNGLDPPVRLPAGELARWQQTTAPDRSAWAMHMIGVLRQVGLADRLIEVALANHPIYLSKAREKWGNKESLIYDDIRRCLQKQRERESPIRIDLHAALTVTETASLPETWLRPISALLGQPELPIDWLVQDLFSAGSSGWIGAEAKVGKSWLTAELTYCLATAVPFLGRFAVPRRRRVIYIQEEDSEQRVLRRFNKLLRGTPGREWPPDTHLKFAIRSGFKIDNPSWAARLRQELAAFPADLVVLDVFQRLHLKSENDQAQMAEVLEVLNALTREFGCGFLVVHHNRKLQAGNEARPNQMLRGSGVLAGWSECSLYCTKGKGKNRFLVTPESKDAAEIEAFVVLLEDTDSQGVRLVPAETTQHDRLLSQGLQVFAMVQKMTDDEHDCTAQSVAEAMKWSKARTYRILEYLVEIGQLEVDEAIFNGKAAKLYVLPTEEREPMWQG